MRTEPEVSVPIVMRNYHHEVLRNDLAKVLTPLAATGDLADVLVSRCVRLALP